MAADASSESEQLRRAIAVLETQRIVLGDAIVDTALAPLREKLAALEQTRPRQQRKQVTVLFADISGFTALSEKLDAEDITDVMNSLWQRLDRAITGQGGTIDKHIGDAVMALWGVGQAHESDVEQAIYAALAMQAELANIRDQQGVTLAMRVGINTGMVLLGEVATTHEFTAMGDTVNTASRLEHAAPVGGILVSHDTYRLVRGLFDFHVLEPISVKGKIQPLRVYVVAGPRPRPLRRLVRGVEGVETPLVGRSVEFAYLQGALRIVIDEAAWRVVTIIGEPGLGKTRLLDEFETWADRLPDPVYYFKGQAFSQNQGQPFALLRDLFVGRFDIRESDPLEVVQHKVEQGITEALPDDPNSRMKAHYIGAMLGFDFSHSPYLSGYKEDTRPLQSAALGYLRGYLAALTQRRPVLMVLEDVHWADSSSLDALEAVLGALSRLMVVYAARPALLERYPDWGQSDAHGEVVELKPLNQADSLQLVRKILQGTDGELAKLAEFIAERAEGNPYYIEELIKMLIEDGSLVRQDNGWQVAAERLKLAQIPTTLTGILQARLDGLPPEERDLLQRAAVVGRVFWDEAVAHLQATGQSAGFSDNSADLDMLRQRELIFRQNPSAFENAGEYTFKHAVLRDVAYESVLKRVRQIYHRLVADWLFRSSGDRQNEYLGLIAEHLERGGQVDEAAGFWLRAARQALNLNATREALGYCDRALAYTLPDEQQIPFWLISGKALVWLSEYDAARQRLERGLDLARQAGQIAACAEALAHLGGVGHCVGDYRNALTLLNESLELARQANDQARAALALNELGWIYTRLEEKVLSRTSFEQSLELYRALDDRRGVAGVLNGLGCTLMDFGAAQAATDCLLESLAMSRQANDLRLVSVVCHNLSNFAMLRDDVDAAWDYESEALTLAEEVGEPRKIAIALGGLGEIALIKGDYVSARSYFMNQLKTSRKLSIPLAMDSLVGVALIKAADGQAEEALEIMSLCHHSTGVWTPDPSHVVLIEPALERLRRLLSAEAYAAAWQRGASLDLDAVVSRLLDGST